MGRTEHYESIEELPAFRWHELNLALLIEAGAGGGIDGLKNLLVMAFRHNEAKEHDKANACIVNALQNVTMAEQMQSMIPEAFGATLKVYRGKDVSGMTAEQVAKLIDKKTPLQRLWETVRKKKAPTTPNLKPSFQD